jgi:hypothetical protein
MEILSVAQVQKHMALQIRSEICCGLIHQFDFSAKKHYNGTTTHR